MDLLEEANVTCRLIQFSLEIDTSQSGHRTKKFFPLAAGAFSFRCCACRVPLSAWGGVSRCKTLHTTR
jgi:hypothetical protein